MYEWNHTDNINRKSVVYLATNVCCRNEELQKNLNIALPQLLINLFIALLHFSLALRYRKSILSMLALIKFGGLYVIALIFGYPRRKVMIYTNHFSAFSVVYWFYSVSIHLLNKQSRKKQESENISNQDCSRYRMGVCLIRLTICKLWNLQFLTFIDYDSWC